jgi:hypothetical protein
MQALRDGTAGMTSPPVSFPNHYLSGHVALIVSCRLCSFYVVFVMHNAAHMLTHVFLFPVFKFHIYFRFEVSFKVTLDLIGHI